MISLSDTYVSPTSSFHRAACQYELLISSSSVPDVLVATISDGEDTPTPEIDAISLSTAAAAAAMSGWRCVAVL